MLDITDFEGRGLPGVMVAAAALQAEALGFEPASVFIPHPIQDRTDDEINALADGAAEDIVAALTR